MRAASFLITLHIYNIFRHVKVLPTYRNHDLARVDVRAFNASRNDNDDDDDKKIYKKYNKK